MALIETVGLGQRRGDQEILKDVSFSVDAGEVFALIGPTGSGKTTLLRLVDLIDTPATGRVYFDGEDVTESAQRRFAARRRMAFVLQKPIVFNASVFDNVACGLKWRGVSGGELRSRVAEVLDRVGLGDYRQRRARTLSGGEVQMVAIARAMAIQPEVLLLDEPTANLDPASTTRIEEMIAGIIDRGGDSGHRKTTILMTTHDMSQGQRLADRAAILLDGEIHQTGEWREIFSSPRSHRIADFVGVENVIDGVVTASRERVVTLAASGASGAAVLQALADFPVGEPVFACVRAEDVTLSLHEVSSSARNTFAGEIARVTAAGPVAHVEIDCGFRLTALVTRLSAEEMALVPGVRVHGAFKATAVHVIRRESAAAQDKSEAER